MYISIDMDKMQFLHKHADYRCVANLDFIAHKQTTLGLTDDPGLFKDFTDQELALLYKHATHADHVPAISHSLRMVLADLTERFPVSAADPAEAEAQAEWLERKSADGKPGYSYVAGSSVPKWQEVTLFSDPLPAPTAAEVAATVQKHTARSLQRGQQHAAAAAATEAAPKRSAAHAPRRAATAARPKSGVCQQIWATLDAERTINNGAAPSRARIKELAVQHGWNPNTVSVQGAAWRKANSLS